MDRIVTVRTDAPIPHRGLSGKYFCELHKVSFNNHCGACWSDFLAASTFNQAIADVAAERQRQVGEEGWSAEHDDEHAADDLANAAACYILKNVCEERVYIKGSVYRTVRLWPWDLSWWKPKSRRRDLVRAAALIVAEIERLDRQPPVTK